MSDSFGVDQIPASILSIESVPINGFNTGFVNFASDHDWFRINLAAGGTYIFDAVGSALGSVPPLSDPTLALWNAAGTQQLAFDNNGGSGLNSRIEFTAATSGTYFLDVGGFDTTIGSYTLSAAVAGSVAVSDVAIVEGNSGTRVAVFTVVRSGGTAAFNVNYATADGSATTADGDYLANSNTLQFAANETSKTFSVVINGDTKGEANETFNVNLSGATNGATISDAQGVGTIINDDAAHGVGDFNGDRTSDLLMQRSDGTFLVGNFTNNQFSALTFPGQIGLEWQTLGIGDFNGDRTSDLLMQRSDGTFLVGNFTNNQFSALTFPGQIGLEWQTLGIGDFNNDGTSDLLMQRSDGTFLVGNFTNNQFSALTFPGQIGLEWQTLGIGDFNGDRTSDLLMQRSDGTFLVGNFTNSQFSALTFPGQIGLEWQTLGIGDFNGDRTSDLLMQRSDGTFLVGNFTNNQFSALTFPGQIGLEWQTLGIGDFNNDGTSDLLMQRSDGTFLVGDFTNNQFSAFTFPGQFGLEWQIV